jgi:hypothetical protein
MSRSTDVYPDPLFRGVESVGAVMDDDFSASSGVLRKTSAGVYEANDEIQAGVGGLVSVLTDATTVAVDASLANFYTLTLGDNRTLGNPSNGHAGQTIQIQITQDGTGTRTLAYGNNWTFEGGSAPVLSTGAGDVDILTAITFDGTTWSGRLTKAWA